MRSEAGRRRTGEQAAYTIRSITVAIDTQLRPKITRLPNARRAQQSRYRILRDRSITHKIKKVAVNLSWTVS